MRQADIAARIACGTAGILHELAHEIEALGEKFCRDSHFTAAHLDELQAIDLIAQKLSSLGTVLAADCPATAVGEMQLEVLRDRFVGLSAPVLLDR